ncbi:MAG: glycosyltransferase family protein [Rickettsiales bacterium]|jgi:glycosyltransferase family protein
MILFLKNISYLFTRDLKKIAKESALKYLTREDLNYALDGMKYELVDDLKNVKIPNIKTPLETIEYLVNNNVSFCRYGDGEFLIMEGKDIAFQKYHHQLAEKLNEVFISDEKNILIGINYSWYHSVAHLRGFVKDFMRIWVGKNRGKLTAICDSEKKYWDAGCTQLYAICEEFDFDDYFTKVMQIWKGRDVVIICGKNIFDKIKFNIFNCSSSVEYQYAPNRNAFEEYDQILEQALKIDKNKLVIIILGPTATILAYNLAKLGYKALDFGHIAKDYDCYRHKIDHSQKTIIDFFKPD